MKVLAEALVLDVRRLFGEEDHDEEGKQHHDSGEAIDVLPAEVRREAWSKERGECGATVACAGDAHGETFVFWREPARAERERHAEAGSCDAQQDTHGENVVIGLDEEEAVKQGDDDGGHLDDGGLLSADVLREDAEWKAHERASKRGNGDHESDLARGRDGTVLR